MKKITTLFMMAIMALAWTSCTDKDDPTPDAKTKSELLAAHTWELTAATISPAYEGSTNIFEIEPCYQENTESYSSNGNFSKDEGSNKCGNVEQIRTGNWSFNSTETIIELDYSGNAPDESYNILELSETTFKYSGIIPIEGVDYTLTFTFTAQ